MSLTRDLQDSITLETAKRDAVRALGVIEDLFVSRITPEDWRDITRYSDGKLTEDNLSDEVQVFIDVCAKCEDIRNLIRKVGK